MYDKQTLLGSFSNYGRLPGARAYKHTSFGAIECGKVIWAKFDHKNTVTTSVS
jgi:hypothetical protein